MMTCADVRDRLDALLEGRLAPEDAASILGHVATCAECREDLSAAEELRPLVASLSRHIEPPPELWGAIRRNLRSPERPDATRWSRRSVVFVLATAAIVLIALSSLITLEVVRRTGRSTRPAIAVVAWEADYRAAAADLHTELQRRRSQLPTSTILAVERDLAVIDSAISEAGRALSGEPNDTTLRRLLRSSHEQKLALLRRAVFLGPET